jgi:hypothetical protein
MIKKHHIQKGLTRRALTSRSTRPERPLRSKGTDPKGHYVQKLLDIRAIAFRKDRSKGPQRSKGTVFVPFLVIFRPNDYLFFFIFGLINITLFWEMWPFVIRFFVVNPDFVYSYCHKKTQREFWEAFFQRNTSDSQN